MKNKFKIGDKVYCSNYTTEICQIQANSYIEVVRLSDDVSVYDMQECGLTLSSDGKTLDIDYDSNVYVRLSHATQENYELLSKLYPNVEFEKPPVRKESTEVIQAMLDDGWISVGDELPEAELGYLTDYYFEPKNFYLIQLQDGFIDIACFANYYDVDDDKDLFVSCTVKSKNGSYGVLEYQLDSYSIEEVKHWQPLPQPPKEK